MFLMWLSTKIAQTVQLYWTRWPPELKIEKPSIDFPLLNQCIDFKKIIQECSLGDYPLKFLKPFRSVEQDGCQGYK